MRSEVQLKEENLRYKKTVSSLEVVIKQLRSYLRDLFV